MVAAIREHTNTFLNLLEAPALGGDTAARTGGPSTEENVSRAVAPVHQWVTMQGISRTLQMANSTLKQCLLPRSVVSEHYG